ncbi:two-component response regulator ARR20 [Carex littledalei]|uniref:Two-component response regulator ARR20 n=1 Tax=Carex littledalei TaxID=544730 RepID=A0A833VEP9_9POAL|nr:two-component response regulator ARR20 [Carex littledalei]
MQADGDALIKLLNARKLEVTNDEQKNQQVPKLRFHWTPDLHYHFELAVNSLGGHFEAKPSTIREAMEAIGASGLTTKNIKSHLQWIRAIWRWLWVFSPSRVFHVKYLVFDCFDFSLDFSFLWVDFALWYSIPLNNGQIQKASEVKGNWGDGLNKFTQKP